MQATDKKEQDRPISYPHKTEADKQLENQPEFEDQEPNDYKKEISDIPGQEAQDDKPSVKSGS